MRLEFHVHQKKGQEKKMSNKRVKSFKDAFLGALVADSLAMPMHWYYDTREIDRVHGDFSHYVDTVSHNSSSILWRSQFTSHNEKDDILHSPHKQHWGKKNVHYHLYLEKGENTLNYQLSYELYKHIIKTKTFDIRSWLEKYVSLMLDPNWNKDTYLEEYHREFFNNYASGKDLINCSAYDMHIGGLATIPGLLAGLESINMVENKEYVLKSVLTLVQSTHNHPETIKAALKFAEILLKIKDNESIDFGIAEKWLQKDDRQIIGLYLSPACYLPGAFTASMYLCQKYKTSFDDGILSNAKCGGDNCHRAAVVGSILGMINGISSKWTDPLKIKL